MREIKFRQPVYEDGKLVWWHYWGYKDGIYQHPMNRNDSYQSLLIVDVNGKEIFEGDIVAYNYGSTTYTKLVIWDSQLSGFTVGVRGYIGDHDGKYSMEVIGNMIENPDILE